MHKTLTHHAYKIDFMLKHHP